MPETTRRDHARDGRGRWLRGVSGNAAGRPAGARHRTTLAAEALLAGEAERLVRRCVDLALEGDPVALKLCLERILPPMRHRPPPAIQADTSNPDGIVAAMSIIMQHVLAGELTAEEGERMARLLATTYQAQRAAQAQRIEELIERLQQSVAAGAPQRGCLEASA